MHSIWKCTTQLSRSRPCWSTLKKNNQSSLQTRPALNSSAILTCLGRRHQSGARVPSVDPLVLKYANTMQPTKLSLPTIRDFSRREKLIDFARFMWRELPIRVAQRATELSRLPYHLSEMESVQKVRDSYVESFHLIKAQAEPDSEESAESFSSVVSGHFGKMANAVELIAMGISECLSTYPGQADNVKSCPFLNAFLDDFHSARIGTRLLTGQFTTVTQQYKSPAFASSDCLGIIDDECKPAQILRNAADDASRLCQSNFYKSPPVRVYDPRSVTMTYIPSHLHYVFFELMKNSMRAVCENFPDADDDDLPPIDAVIIGNPDSQAVTVKLSDRGGGIPKQNLDLIWNYSFTTVQEQPTIADAAQVQPMSGFGYGLPLSRLHCRYFGGDLGVVSLDGYGTDAYVYLHYLNTRDD